jgi:hypothetical protein
MSGKVRLPWIAAAALVAGSSALLAAAQTGQQPAAQAEQASPARDARAADTVSTLTVGTPDNTGALHPRQNLSAMPLTAAECADLGGHVNVDTVGICATGFFCGTTDAYGKKHRVCLSKL